MASLLLQNLDDESLKSIKQLAQLNGFAVEDYITDILKKTVAIPKTKQELLKLSQQSRQQTAYKQKTNTLDLLHESRNER